MVVCVFCLRPNRHIELLPTHEVLFVYFFTCALCMMFSVSFFISYCVQSAVHVGHDAGDAVAEPQNIPAH